MSPIDFDRGLKRLVTRFGERNFDAEFIKLVWREVSDMSDSGFARFCDVLIGSRSANKPPLLSEFREARLAEQKVRFDNDVRGAGQFVKRQGPKEMRKNLDQILSKEFGAVEGVKDAFEIARLRLKTKGLA